MMVQKKDTLTRWIALILVLFLLGTISFFFALFIGIFISQGDITQSGNIAIIPIEGIIQTGQDAFFLSTTVASSDTIIEQIKKAESDPAIHAVIFRINSPGGYPVPSQEIVEAIKTMNKTSVAVIRDVGASGAYWIASASDRIYANSFSITGSIGVNSAFLTFGGLLADYNISYERIVGGEFKDMGSPYKDVTPEERRKLQELSDSAHRIFINDVARNLNMPVSKLEGLATGEVFLGADAVQKGLVHDIGGIPQALSYIETELNISAAPIIYQKKQTFIDIFSSGLQSHGEAMGFGLGRSLTDPEVGNRYRIVT